MKCDCLMIHYGELSTKGENRKSFISCLTRNCRAALKGTDCVLSGRRDHLYVERDKRCLDEYLTYEEHDGSFDAIEGKHDDLLMTRAIGLWVCYKEMPRPYFVKIGSQSYTAAATMP